MIKELFSCQMLSKKWKTLRNYRKQVHFIDNIILAQELLTFFYKISCSLNKNCISSEGMEALSDSLEILTALQELR